MLDHVERESRVRQRKVLKEDKMPEISVIESDGSSGIVRPLTLTHTQGPIVILLTGMFIGTASFFIEWLTSFFDKTRK